MKLLSVFLFILSSTYCSGNEYQNTYQPVSSPVSYGGGKVEEYPVSYSAPIEGSYSPAIQQTYPISAPISIPAAFPIVVPDKKKKFGLKKILKKVGKAALFAPIKIPLMIKGKIIGAAIGAPIGAVVGAKVGAVKGALVGKALVAKKLFLLKKKAKLLKAAIVKPFILLGGAKAALFKKASVFTLPKAGFISAGLPQVSQTLVSSGDNYNNYESHVPQTSWVPSLPSFKSFLPSIPSFEIPKIVPVPLLNHGPKKIEATFVYTKGHGSSGDSYSNSYSDSRIGSSDEN